MGDAVRGRTRNFFLVENNSSRGGCERPGEQVEERGLAGAVRADDRVQRARFDAQAYAADCREGAERLGQVFCLENCHFLNREKTSTTPPRKKSTTITNATPSNSGQRAQTVLMDSESQMKTKEPMIGP